MSVAEPEIAKLYAAHARELYSFVRRRIGCQEAEDIVQDTYLHLLQCWRDTKLECPQAFLFRIAVNLTTDALRKTKIRAHYSIEDIDFGALTVSDPTPEETTGSVLELEQVLTVLHELPLSWRTAFLLRRLDQLTYTEIAGQLGISTRTVERYVLKVSEFLNNHIACRCKAASRVETSIGSEKKLPGTGSHRSVKTRTFTKAPKVNHRPEFSPCL